MLALEHVTKRYDGKVVVDAIDLAGCRANACADWSRLCNIELPLATRNILSGIKTAAVMNVGFTSLGR